MKIRYIIFIIILIVLAAGFVIYLFASPTPASGDRLSNAIQGAGVFIALIAAVIALSTADRKRQTVLVEIETFGDQNGATYRKADMSPELKAIYQTFPDPIESRRVSFRIRNTSGFTLRNPSLTFRLPRDKQHPEKGQPVHTRRTFHSNLYNSQRDFRTLEFADTLILSNSNLPFWNNQDDMTIWIRMVLDDGSLTPFQVDVSVNCENADGITKKLQIEPKKLIK